jgi:hypothetical protein
MPAWSGGNDWKTLGATTMAKNTMLPASAPTTQSSIAASVAMAFFSVSFDLKAACLSFV